MPWKNTGGKEFFFTGNLELWMRDYRKMLAEDKSRNPQLNEPYYLGGFSMLCLAMGSEMFANNPEKLAKLRSFVKRTPDGGTDLDGLNLLDFLADNVAYSSFHQALPMIRANLKDKLKLK